LDQIRPRLLKKFSISRKKKRAFKIGGEDLQKKSHWSTEEIKDQRPEKPALTDKNRERGA